MPIDPALLQEIDHFRDLTTPEKIALGERIDLHGFRPGEIILSYGDPGHALYIVRSGEVEIYIKNDNGEKIVLEVAKPGDVFGEISLIDDGPRTAWVSAVGQVEVLRLDRAHFEEYVRLYTPAALNLLRVTARRLRTSDDYLRRTVSRNANHVEAQSRAWSERIADNIANWSGSLRSVGMHATIFAVYIIVNVSAFQVIKTFDPYPFGLLSVMVGMEGILLTLFVLASQNRQRGRDGIRSDIEFESSVNTELKIAYLHEKIDRLREENYRLQAGVQKLLER